MVHENAQGELPAARGGISPLGAWFTFGLVGLVVGVVSTYFGYLAWPAALGLVVISVLSRPRFPTLAGALVGTGLGSALLLWIGSQCPPATTCERQGIEPYVGFAIVTLALGAALSLFAFLRSR
jgi:hypothetical protein